MRGSPIPVLLASCLLLAGPLGAYEVAECDGDATLGNAAIVKGWLAPTQVTIGTIQIDNQGSPNSGLSAAAVNNDWANALAQWTSVPSTTLQVPATISQAVTPVQLQTSLSAGDTRRLWLVVQPTTTKSGASPETGWAQITGTDPQSFLGLTFTVFDLNSREFVDADVLINDDPTPAGPRFYSRSVGAPIFGRFDLQGIMAHELGHFFGSDHSTQAGALMRAQAFAGVNVDVQVDDQNFLQFMYPGAGAAPPNPDSANLALTSCTSIAVSGGGTSSGTSSSSGGGSGGCQALPGGGHGFPWVPGLAFLGLLLAWPRFRRSRSGATLEGEASR